MTDTPASRSRQPVHKMYGGADLFAPDTTAKLGAIALRTLREHAPDADTLASALGFSRDLSDRIYPRVVAKLEREPVEDYRLDFEDGFGNRPDDEEDAVA
ncbi:MAG TPA: phosphoenolpyruvate kinase, partial [Casimicrobiaceae bacterium]|nr:phosphoenolpyruvate kinase [Casimicrobiaceae bacterium]